MKPKTFLRKFPEAKPNENCLLDIACPKCGNRDSFIIEAIVTVTVHDDGTDDDASGHEWRSKSHTRCSECDMHGPLSKFTIDGLDAILEEQSS